MGLLESSSSDSEDETKLIAERHHVSENSVRSETHVNQNVTCTDGPSRLPFAVLLIMKIICVYHHGNVTGNRRCFRCKIQDSKERAKHIYQDDHFTWNMENHYLDVLSQWYYDDDDVCTNRYQRISKQPACHCCESYWWNYNGLSVRYTDQQLGMSPWNHPGSWFISVTVILGAISVLIYDFIFYVHDIDIQTQALHIISYADFLVSLLLYPALNFISQVTSAAVNRGQGGVSWTVVFNVRYITKRLQFIGFRQKGIPSKPALIACLLVPPAIAAYRGFIYYHFMGHMTRHALISVFCCGAIMTITCAFQYVVYLMRLSFERQFFLLTEHIAMYLDDIDRCRQALGHAIQDFNCFRKYVGIFTVLSLTIVTWGVTCAVYWQYLLHLSTCSIQDNKAIANMSRYVTILGCADIFFPFLFAIWAIGGFDVSYVFDHLRRTIVNMSGKSSSKVLQDILDFIDFITVEPRLGFQATSVFTLLDIFLAFRLGQEQSVLYFENAPNCSTHGDLHITTPQS